MGLTSSPRPCNGSISSPAGRQDPQGMEGGLYLSCVPVVRVTNAIRRAQVLTEGGALGGGALVLPIRSGLSVLSGIWSRGVIGWLLAWLLLCVIGVLLGFVWCACSF